MSSSEFNYRQQLILIYQCLQELANGLYASAFNIAIHGELSYFKEIMEDGDEIPGDLNYLKSLKSAAVGGLVRMIEQVFIMQQTLVNLNALEQEELEQFVKEYLEDEDCPEPEPVNIAEDAMCFTFSQLMDLFIFTWQLENASQETPNEVIQLFEDRFFEDTLEPGFEDSNARRLVEGINTLLEINRGIDYYDGNP